MKMNINYIVTVLDLLLRQTINEFMKINNFKIYNMNKAMNYLTTETINMFLLFFLFSFLLARSIASCLSMGGLWKRRKKRGRGREDNHLSSL